MNIKTLINPVLNLFNLPTFMPSSAKADLIAEVNGSNYRVSQIMMLKNAIAVCVYNNKSRHNSYVYRINKDGSGISCVHSDSNRETIGMSDKPVSFNGNKVYVLPSEDGSKSSVLYLDYNSGAVGALPFKAPYQYSEVACGSVVYFSGKGKGGFYDVIKGTQLNKNLNPVPGIVFGMIEDDGNYICACDDGGLLTSDGWNIGDMVSDVNFAGKKMIAFLREGKVRVVKSKKLSSEIGNTKTKPRRSVQDESNALCYWTTHGPQQLWVTNGSDCKKLCDFGGDVISDPSKEGSAFSSAVAFEDDDTLFVATTKSNNTGFRLYKVRIKW